MLTLPRLYRTGTLSELLSYLLFPLARLISRDTPSKLRTALANGAKTLTALEVALALYAISLRYLPAGEFLDKIELPKPWESITDPWDLLIILSVLIIVHHAGGKVAMNLKFLLQPTLDKLKEDLREEVKEEVREDIREEVREEVRRDIREEVREEVQGEFQARTTQAMESWLEEQIRAGKVNEDVELPTFGGNGNGSNLSGDNGTEGE